MTPDATTIDEAIEATANYVAQVTYGNDLPPTLSLATQMALWTAGMFGPAGIYPPSGYPDVGQRKVSDWFAQHVIAQGEIEGPAIGDGGVIGAGAVGNAVIRVLYAVKVANADGAITQAQEDATVALFNTSWAVYPPQLLGPFGGAVPFFVDPAISVEWSGYEVVLTDPTTPGGDGWVLKFAYLFPDGTAPSVEARREEVADAAGVWTPAPNTIGVLLGFGPGANDYPTMADLQTELATVDVSLNDFGNVLFSDVIDGASGIGTTPTATFST